ncbi:DUF2795 domain-containing protein [Pararobbsia silviterrae]|uniref:DUF2795 domain-containing protein n=1 Tax=Pararobbsia silviterrae TaxID=1792498 RepID=A0A494YHE1_9BURK|nr:DUF2795 domain-containing protein [Pararobbsia silviterrae]RKP59437.1 DUF2795 domain-containing protein [Pararobbsia silviterrae]
MSDHRDKRASRPAHSSASRGTRLPNPIEVQKALGGLAYPASKRALVECARARGAKHEIVSTLDQLPDGDYVGPAAISRAMGKLWH